MMIAPGSPNPVMMCGGGDPLDEYGKVERSVRNRRSAGAYWSRTFIAVGSLTTWTLGFKCKRANLANALRIFGIGNDIDAVSQHSVSLIGGTGELQFFLGDAGGATVGNVFTASKFCDPGSHYDVLIVWDTTNPTPSERMRVFVNSERQSAGSPTYPAQNTPGLVNSNVLHRLGALSASTSAWFDGLLSHVLFVDGKAMAPTSFGLVHPRTGQWRPKSKEAIRSAVAAGGGSRNGWGTNGFFLPFDDTTSLTTLGYDRSQSDTDTTGNNWTATNVSLTAGATYDSMLDTPTTNYAVLNSIVHPVGSGAVISGGLEVQGSHLVSNTVCRSTLALPTDRPVFFEYQYTSAPTIVQVGVVSAVSYSNQLWAASSGVSYDKNGNKRVMGATSAYGATWDAGDIIGVGCDPVAQTVTFWKNGVSQGAINAPALFTSDLLFFAANTDDYNSPKSIVNFGQRPFSYPQSGYKTLCAKNLPYPSFTKSDSVFVARADSGANIQATLSAASSWSDWIRIYKRRDAAEGWRWQFSDDAGNYLDSSGTAAKAAFPALAGTSYVGYAIKVAAANGVAMGRLAHVNGVADVVTDGLGNARKLVILRNESGGSWYVYHPDLTAGKLLYLEQSGAEATDSSISTITASGFTVAAALPSGTYRWISIAETAGLCKLGKHNGNGSNDGPFDPADFLPAFSLFKSNAVGSYWATLDNARAQYNVVSQSMWMNRTDGDQSNIPAADHVSNGVKLRSGASADNANYSGYVTWFLLFAAFPFRYANAR